MDTRTSVGMDPRAPTIATACFTSTTDSSGAPVPPVLFDLTPDYPWRRLSSSSSNATGVINWDAQAPLQQLASADDDDAADARDTRTPDLTLAMAPTTQSSSFDGPSSLLTAVASVRPVDDVLGVATGKSTTLVATSKTRARASRAIDSGDSSSSRSSASAKAASCGASASASASAPVRRRQSRQRDPETATLSALELRRKHNRESMQRTRERERREVEGMRRALVSLEREYKRVLQLQATAQEQQRDPVLVEYHALASTSKQLKRANFIMRQDLERRRKGYERVERILADYHTEKADVDHLDKDATNSVSAPFAIPTISETEAFALIAQCAQSADQGAAVQSNSSTTGANVLGATLETESPCFGWSVRRKVVGASSVHFLFTKTFANLDPARATARAWDIYKTTEKNHMKPIRVVRFETVQVVNENTHVVARDVVHPRHQGVVLRTIFLRFRLKTPTGFVVGRSCMNPQQPQSSCKEEPAGVRYADISTWLEVNYLDPTQRSGGRSGCEVKFGGYCDYHTTHDLHARFMDVLFSVIQLENRVFEPLVPLLE